jgi:hypothetical protein
MNTKKILPTFCRHVHNLQLDINLCKSQLSCLLLDYMQTRLRHKDDRRNEIHEKNNNRLYLSVLQEGMTENYRANWKNYVLQPPLPRIVMKFGNFNCFLHYLIQFGKVFAKSFSPLYEVSLNADSKTFCSIFFK